MWAVVCSVDGITFGDWLSGDYVEGNSCEVIEFYWANAMNTAVTFFQGS